MTIKPCHKFHIIEYDIETKPKPKENQRITKKSSLHHIETHSSVAVVETDQQKFSFASGRCCLDESHTLQKHGHLELIRIHKLTRYKNYGILT